MEVILAETAGFCMGVGLALKKLNKTVGQKENGDKINTLGPIIHNPQVLEHYRQHGVDVIETPDEAHAGDTVVIRAHGIPRTVEECLRNKDVKIHDATCPKVKKAQLLIAKQTAAGRTLLLFGEADHPEVRGLLSYASDDAIVFESLEELKKVLKPGTAYFLAAQTTQDRKLFEHIKKYLLDTLPEAMPILETICDATQIRQQEAIEIARKVDKMVVAGGRNSGNTRRLVQVVEEQGTECFHVETADELRAEDFSDAKTVGLSAGASTPDTIIRSIYETLHSF